jgi:2-C-methyl-D-erythritol 4-phosphate cytidylyltransferase
VHQEYVIIVAGGTGSRIKSDKPKQFIELCGLPIIIRTIKAFLAYNVSIKVIISVHRDYSSLLTELIKIFLPEKENIIKITLGGDTRFQSVKNGLDLINDSKAIVAIHDAARPLVSTQTIKNCFKTAALKGNAVPCVAVNESIREVNVSHNVAVNRSAFKIIQTPQCFEAALIKRAFDQPYNSSFTDDATVLESTGGKINLVEGNPENIKITSPHDLLIAKALINE